jgi:G:T/U-mismatch repair DNA glycosylase
MNEHKLPDLLAPNLRVIFVGTAAGKRSAEFGHYYAGRGNRFWRTLHEVGLTPRLFEPGEFRALLALGIGHTCHPRALSRGASSPHAPEQAGGWIIGTSQDKPDHDGYRRRIGSRCELCHRR